MVDALQTERLLIRLPRMADAPACAAHLNTLEISKWPGMVPYPYGVSDAEEFIADHTGAFPKSAFIFEQGVLIGGIGIDQELGYWLASEAWGKGYATEASSALIDYHFANTDVDHIMSGYHAGNVRSKNVLARLGFKPSGTRRSTPKSTRVEVDLHEVRLTRADWEARV